MHVRPALLRPEAGRLRTAVAVAPGDRPFADRAGPQDAGPQAVAIIDHVEHRILADLLDCLTSRQRLLLQPPNRLVEQLAVVKSSAACFPNRVALQAADLLYAPLA